MRLKAVLLCLLASLLACMPIAPASSDASNVNAFLSTYRADVGSSVALGDGRVLWLFGDTINTAGWDRNSAVIQTGNTFTRVPGTFAEPSEPGHWYWPSGAVREGNRLRVLAMDFTCPTPCGAFDMKYQRTDVLTYSLPDLKFQWRSELPARPSGAMWSTLTKAGDGHVYVYGSYTVPGEIAKGVEVARIPYGDLTHPGSWEYLGTKMGPSMELGTMVSVAKRSSGGYRAYSKHLDLFGSTVIAYDSPSPHGPWGPRQTVASIPAPAGRWTYGVEVHPEQAAAAGKFLISYSTNCDALPCPAYGVTALEVAAP